MALGSGLGIKKMSSSLLLSSSLWRWVLVFGLLMAVCAMTEEEERVIEHHQRGYTYPPLDMIRPDEPRYKKLMLHRLRQVEEMEDSVERWEGYAQTLSAAMLQPNLTEHGFALARAPEELTASLRQGIRDGLEAGPELEEQSMGISGPTPWFVHKPELRDRVLKELHHYPETWANMELTANNAYGFRLYRNNSRLRVHVDKPETHIISFILHIDSSDDAEPWPILIEDLQGTTHEIVLTSGDILLYESSKVFHGRPRTFHGSWYCSVFVHYYPKYGWVDNYDKMNMVYAIPPHWMAPPTTKFEYPLRMYGTSMEEPECPNTWCETKNSKKWSGPGEEGYLILPFGGDGSSSSSSSSSGGDDGDGGDRVEEKEDDDTMMIMRMRMTTDQQKMIPFHPKKLNCVDVTDECLHWSTQETDECVKNNFFMAVFCPKSCGHCSTSSSTTTTTTTTTTSDETNVNDDVTTTTTRTTTTTVTDEF